MAQSVVEGVFDARGWGCLGVCTEPVWFCEAGGDVSARVYAMDGCRDDGLFGVRAAEPGHAVAAAPGPDTVCGVYLVLSVPGAWRGVEHVHGLVVFDVVPRGREGGWVGVREFYTVGVSSEFPVDGGVSVGNDYFGR